MKTHPFLIMLLLVSFSCQAQGDLVGPDMTLSGSGILSTDTVNQGSIIGRGTGEGERLIFDASSTVSGSGHFENTLVLGTFAPGNSPTISNGTNQAFGGTVEIELGGTTPGSGNDNHDQINDTATIWLFNSPTLSILPWNGFIPSGGDQFVIMTWQTGLVGNFGTVAIDPFFTDNGISFSQTITNASGPGNLTVTAIPEPSAFLFLGAIAVLAGIGERIRRKY